MVLLPGPSIPPWPVPRFVPPRPPDDPYLGRVIGNYLLVEWIGSGGVAQVYRARHTRSHKSAAIKIMRPMHQNSGTAWARCDREAWAGVRVDHPNVVRVENRGTTEDGLPYLVMELVLGWTLCDALADGPLTQSRCADLGAAVIMGLRAIHRVGFIHRDIKPTNIMLTRDKHLARIIDLGLVTAWGASSTDPRLTNPGHLTGTPLYLAPEVIAGEPPQTASDLYSLGATLFEMLTGRPPFDHDRISDILAGHLGQPVPPIPHFGGLGPLTQALLRKDPETRPTTENVARRLMAIRPRRPS